MDKDPAYLLLRSLMAEKAEGYANKMYGAKAKGKTEKEREDWCAKWNRCYHEKIKEMWNMRGAFDG